MKLKPGSVASYTIRPENTSGLWVQFLKPTWGLFMTELWLFTNDMTISKSNVFKGCGKNLGKIWLASVTETRAWDGWHHLHSVIQIQLLKLTICRYHVTPCWWWTDPRGVPCPQRTLASKQLRSQPHSGRHMHSRCVGSQQQWQLSRQRRLRLSLTAFTSSTCVGHQHNNADVLHKKATLLLQTRAMLRQPSHGFCTNSAASFVFLS